MVEFHGEFHDFPPMDPEPRPVQRPIPILIGGHTDIALERAGRIGDGWIAGQMSPERVGEHWPRVLEVGRAQRARSRVARLGDERLRVGPGSLSAICCSRTATRASTTRMSGSASPRARRPSTSSATAPENVLPDLHS